MRDDGLSTFMFAPKHPLHLQYDSRTYVHTNKPNPFSSGVLTKMKISTCLLGEEEFGRGGLASPVFRALYNRFLGSKECRTRNEWVIRGGGVYFGIVSSRYFVIGGRITSFHVRVTLPCSRIP